MNILEKFFSVLAIISEIGLLILLATFPELRTFDKLVPVCLLGIAINSGLLFIILRDIFYRPFTNTNQKYAWLVLVLLVWPSMIYYLARYGFKTRLPSSA